jgi:hypothetical protein
VLQRSQHGILRLSPERRSRLLALPGWGWNLRASRWEGAFAMLRAYADEHGKANPSAECVVEGFRLGRWVTKQRAAFAEDRLDPGRAERLASLPGWSWDPYGEAWEEGFGILGRFVAREGHALVPQEHVEDGFRLGQWVSSQRTSFAWGDMRADRAERLQQLRGWAWDPYKERWELGISLLRRYVAREGHSRVPVKHVEDGFPLGAWVSNQRASYASGGLKPDQAQRLSLVPNWVWRVADDKWERNFARLDAFVTREGHARVPYQYAEDGVRLGNWVQAQRGAWKNGRQGEEKIERLEGLQGWVWDANEATWEDGFDALVRYGRREGHARVPRIHMEDGYPLGQWVTVQRRQRRTGGLPPERAARLESVLGWTWDPPRGGAARRRAS